MVKPPERFRRTGRRGGCARDEKALGTSYRCNPQGGSCPLPPAAGVARERPKGELAIPGKYLGGDACSWIRLPNLVKSVGTDCARNECSSSLMRRGLFTYTSIGVRQGKACQDQNRRRSGNAENRLEILGARRDTGRNCAYKVSYFSPEARRPKSKPAPHSAVAQPPTV